MALCPQAVDGQDGLQIWRDDANIMKTMSQTADKGGLPAWELGEVLTTLTLEH